MGMSSAIALQPACRRDHAAGDAEDRQLPASAGRGSVQAAAHLGKEVHISPNPKMIAIAKPETIAISTRIRTS